MSNLLRIVPDKGDRLQRKTMEELRAQRPRGNFRELINPTIPAVPVNSINDVIRTGAQGFIGGQEATPLQFQAATGFADPLEVNRLNINDYLIRESEDPLSRNYVDEGAGVGLNLVRDEINAERDSELRELKSLKLNEFLSPGETGRILDPREQTVRAARLQNIKTLVRQSGIRSATDEELGRLEYLNRLYPENTGFQESVEGEVNNLFNKIKVEASKGIRNTYDSLTPDQQQLMTGIVANYLFNLGLKAYDIGNEYLIDLFGLRDITKEDINNLGGELYNTGLKAYDTIRNMPYNILYNWFAGKKYSGMDGGEEYTIKDLDDLEKVLRQEKKITEETGKETPLDPEIKETLKEVKKIKEEIEYGGTAYEGEEKRKYYSSPEYRELVSRLGRLYKDVTNYRQGPISGAGHIEPTGALTPQSNSQIPMGVNINQRLTPAELKALKKQRKQQSKTIKQFYGEAPELNQSIEPAPEHNNNPTQGPIFDVPDSSPRQMQAAVLNPQDIINQMKKGKKNKQASGILGKERSTKESTRAQNRLG